MPEGNGWQVLVNAAIERLSNGVEKNDGRIHNLEVDSAIQKWTNRLIKWGVVFIMTVIVNVLIKVIWK